jgi:gliding motility-associated-like protein
VCHGEVAELKTTEAYATYLWQDGSTDPYYLTSDAGNYSVLATDINGCINSDTVNVALFPVPEVDIGNDTTLCEGELITLDAGSYFTSYTWWNNSGNQEVETTETGELWVYVTDTNSCTGGDSINIDRIQLPFVDLGADTTICEDVEIELTAGEGDFEYYWWDGSTGQSVYVSDSGEYWVSVSNKCGEMTAYRMITVMDCNPDIYFPNAFTPNGDGKNDRFLPVPLVQGIFDSRMIIFNRFGQTVFQQENINQGWDGTCKGTPCPPGTYIWQVYYKHYADGINLSENSLLGYITLLR